MELPENLVWGVDIAIKKLRPNVTSFQIAGTEITEWEDSSGAEAPTWPEVCTQIEQDQKAAQNWLDNNSAN